MKNVFFSRLYFVTFFSHLFVLSFFISFFSASFIHIPLFLETPALKPGAGRLKKSINIRRYLSKIVR